MLRISSFTALRRLLVPTSLFVALSMAGCPATPNADSGESGRLQTEAADDSAGDTGLIDTGATDAGSSGAAGTDVGDAGDSPSDADAVGSPPSSDDGATVGYSNFDVDCGTRSAVSIPENVYIERGGRQVFTVDPPDSPLARAFMPESFCGDRAPAATSTEAKYKVGAGGVVEMYCLTFGEGDSRMTSCTIPSVTQRFLLTDGCLDFRSDASEVATLDEEWIAEMEEEVRRQFEEMEFESACPPGQSRLFQSGEPYGEEGEPYACVSYVPSFCTDCYYSDGRWIQVLTMTNTITAHSNLSGVRVRATSCSPESSVDIVAGQSATIRTVIEVTYEIVPAPTGPVIVSP